MIKENKIDLTDQCFFRAYVLNLKKDIEKKRKIKKNLSKFSFNNCFVNSIDGSENINSKNYNDSLRRLFLGRSLLNKEIAIMETHKKALNKIIHSKVPYNLILEDDVEIPLHFEKILKKILSVEYKWDLIRFIDKPKFKQQKGRIVLKIDKNYSLVRFPKLPGGAYGYLVSQSGAKKILDISSSYYHPIDILFGQTWKKNLNSIFCVPGIIIHPPVPDEIEKNDPRYKKVLKTPFKLFFYFRFIFKLYETIMKWGHFLFKLFPDYLTRIKN